MTNEPEWKDANPSQDNLPVKGRDVIVFIAGGIALGVLSIVGMRVRPLGLAIGAFAFISGIMMMARRRKADKTALILIVSGFLMLLAYPGFGAVAGFAVFFLVVGAIGLVVFGLIKAIKLAWDVGRLS